LDISIITINYNNYNLTLNFIESVLKHTSTKIKFEIIIIDNCSEFEDYTNLKEGIKKFEKKIKLFRSNINIGFGAGNMLGTQFASGNFLAFINNDILFVEDCLLSLMNYMAKNTNVGVATSQQINKHLKPTSCFDYFHGIRKELFGRWSVELTSKKEKREAKYYKKPISADFIQGCFMFFDTLKFSEIGGFDTNLFLYYEEMDVCYRLKMKNLLCMLVPETKFIHLHGESTKISYLIKKELKLSQLYIARKNHNYIKYNVIRFIILIKIFFKSIVKPRYFNLLFIILSGKYLENSLKQQQKMSFNKNAI
jgi:GT2 family glycosyltransferase